MPIQLSNVKFSYPDNPDVVVLDIPSWSVSPQETVLIHGASGSGKSTLLNLLSGMLPVVEGQIDIFGQRLDQMTHHQRDRFRANHLGYVFQQFNLIPYLDAIDNVRLASYFAKDKKSLSQLHKYIEELLTMMKLPASEWRKPTRKLSIGQQQRVAIARALINKPQLLIADEPTSALDQKSRDAFLTLLMSILESHKVTLLMVSHDLSLSHYFSRVESLDEINQVKGVL